MRVTGLVTSGCNTWISCISSCLSSRMILTWKDLMLDQQGSMVQQPSMLWWTRLGVRGPARHAVQCSSAPRRCHHLTGAQPAVYSRPAGEETDSRTAPLYSVHLYTAPLYSGTPPTRHPALQCLMLWDCGMGAQILLSPCVGNTYVHPVISSNQILLSVNILYYPSGGTPAPVP